MPRRMQADAMRRLSQVLAAAVFSTLLLIAWPVAPAAHADGYNPCDLPGGAYVCQKVEQGSKSLYENSGAKAVVDSASSAVDFATDPLGYIEDKLRNGTKGMFQAFGQELIGQDRGTSEDSPTGKSVGGDLG